MVKITIQIKGDPAKIELRNHRMRMSNMSIFFINFYTYMQSVIVRQFVKLKSGGRDRGVNWPWFAVQYVRADGTVVPAEGGVKKVKGEGSVLGKLRTSDARVTDRSNLMRDTGRMQSGVLDKRRNTKTILIMDSSTEYTGYQNQLRPFQFFEYPTDYNVAERMARKYIYG